MPVTFNIRKSFSMQHDEADCGVSCLQSILRYYNSDCDLEKLRRFSNTKADGTNLNGLINCAEQIGFKALAILTEIEELDLLTKPLILHLTLRNGLDHFVILYKKIKKWNKEQFLIGDPAQGLKIINKTELIDQWKSKVLLELKPTEMLTTVGSKSKLERRWLLESVREDLQTFFLVIILGLGITALSLATAVFTQKLIDNFLPQSKMTIIVPGLMLLFAVLVVRSYLNYIRQTFLINQTKDYNQRVNLNFFTKILGLSKKFFDSRKVGDMIARMNDVLKIQKNISYIVATVINDVVIALVTGLFILMYSTTISLVVLLFIPIIAGITFTFSKPLRDSQKRSMAAYARNESNYIDTIQGISVIKEANKESDYANRVNQTFSYWQNDNLNLSRIGNRFNLISELANSTLNIIVLSLSVYFVIIHKIKLGEMIAIISLINGLVPAITRLSSINIIIQEGNVALSRMFEFSSLEAEYNNEEKIILDDSISDINSIDFINVNFSYSNEKVILENLSLHINKHEIIAITGKSGIGKTTFIQLLQKFYKADKGVILINGVDINFLETKRWRSLIGTVPQDVKIFNGSIAENISLENDIDIQVIQEFCKVIGLDEYFQSFNKGLNTLVGEEGLNLSGGQKQVIGFVRALYKRPKLLILDEVTSSLDQDTEEAILRIITNLENMMIILITHRPDPLRVADKIYTLKERDITLKKGVESTITK